MSVKPQSITDLAEVWDELTPIQQQFMIQRAKGLARNNKLKEMGIQFKPLHDATHETHDRTGWTEKNKQKQSLRSASSAEIVYK